MGRRLNVSQPVVINTELAPLDDSFVVQPSGQTEQWYYDNTGQYSPNRQTTPLTLTPMVSAFDPDTNTKYEPLFSAAPRWYVTEYNSTLNRYVETEVTATSDGQNVPYFKYGNTLKVKRNVSYSTPVQVRCSAIYIDPRDVGLTHSVETTITLSTNRDASVVFPSLSFANPASRAFNPLVDDNSLYTFNAVAKQGGVDVTNSVYFVWYAIDGTTEVLADTMIWYVGGQNTTTLTVDALFGEEIKLVLRAKENAQSQTLYPNKVYGNVTWKIPDIETNVICENGSAVRSNTTSMTFRASVNVRGRILSDEKVAQNLDFNWKYRKNNASTVNDAGWGVQTTIPASELRNVTGSTNTQSSASVYPIVYVRSSFEVVTHNGVNVTHNNELVYHRSTL